MNPFLYYLEKIHGKRFKDTILSSYLGNVTFIRIQFKCLIDVSVKLQLNMFQV